MGIFFWSVNVSFLPVRKKDAVDGKYLSLHSNQTQLLDLYFNRYIKRTVMKLMFFSLCAIHVLSSSFSYVNILKWVTYENIFCLQFWVLVGNRINIQKWDSFYAQYLLTSIEFGQLFFVELSRFSLSQKSKGYKIGQNENCT